MCYKTPDLKDHISGVILHTETLFQETAGGEKMVDIINASGMIPGIKLDQGYDKAGIPGTKIGPLGHPETMDKGLDTLRKRCAEAYAQGARFAKWRNVLQIDPTQGIPSDLAVREATEQVMPSEERRTAGAKREQYTASPFNWQSFPHSLRSRP